MKWGEQKRVFSMIPALHDAEFLRYGVMHRNTFINSPEALDVDFSLRGRKKTFFAGQITGVEGYVESVASGLAAAIEVWLRLKEKPPVNFTRQTVLGALADYISRAKDFQPMNANYGILEMLNAVYKDKSLKKKAYAERSLAMLAKIKENIGI